MRRMINISPSIKSVETASGVWTCDKNLEKGVYLINTIGDGWSETCVAIYDGETPASASWNDTWITIGAYGYERNQISCDNPESTADVRLELTRLY